MDPRLLTGRVVHGGYPFFKEAAPRIEAVVPPGDLSILTRGALHLKPPARYWFYNTEPLHVVSKRTLAYMALLDGAERVFEYSEPNLPWYPRATFCPIRLGVVRTPPDLAACDIDVLFYGYSTVRRRFVLDELSVVTVTAYGEDLVPWLRRARIVLSVNAYDDVNGNPFRVFPALEQGARLVVERCQEAWVNEAVRPPHALLVPYADLVLTCQAVLLGAVVYGT